MLKRWRNKAWLKADFVFLTENLTLPHYHRLLQLAVIFSVFETTVGVIRGSRWSGEWGEVVLVLGWKDLFQ
jgi:hypothetical protein